MSPKLRLAGRTVSMFQFCGCIGLVFATLLAIVQVAHLGLSQWMLAGITMAAVLTFFGLVMATKIITGEEQIIYYHHEIAVMTVAGLLLWLLRQPVLPYLDITILGIGTFLACGRVGCLMVGCCHGRPHRFGVCYRPEHATAGFTPYYVGVRLLPVQALESIWVACIVVVGGAFLLWGYPSGTALGWYVINYGVMRFCLEFLRGDPERPYHLGFSEAQWISLFLMCGVVWAELKGVSRFHAWHVWATAGVAATMIVMALTRGRAKTARHRLLNPRHVKEVAGMIDAVSEAAEQCAPVSKWEPIPAGVAMGRTSIGIQMSAGRIQDTMGFIRHYTFSAQDELLTPKGAKALADLVLLLKHRDTGSELVESKPGVFHLLIHPLRQSGRRLAPTLFKLMETRDHAV